MPSKFVPFESLPAPQKRRRNLPHWEAPGATYFLTFRLGDCIPAGALAELNDIADRWLKLHGLTERNEVRFLPQTVQDEFRRVVSIQEERWMDAGHGECLLRDATCRRWLVETLAHFNGDRYALDAYVVMPNHVHLLVMPAEGWSLPEIVATWKQFSAKRINAHLGRQGTLWQKETFDHIVRNWEKLETCRRYIEANPKKARLRPGEFCSGCGVGIIAG